jgi:hypothetical protein
MSKDRPLVWCALFLLIPTVGLVITETTKQSVWLPVSIALLAVAIGVHMAKPG